MGPGRPGTGPITAADLTELLTAKTGADPALFVGAAHVALDDLGIDSLAVLELQAVVKQTLGLVVPDDAATMSISEIVDYINAQDAQAGIEAGG
jgi:aromatase